MIARMIAATPVPLPQMGKNTMIFLINIRAAAAVSLHLKLEIHRKVV